jgi:hypothetical protein
MEKEGEKRSFARPEHWCEAGVYDEYIIQNKVLRANLEANNYQYLT